MEESRRSYAPAFLYGITNKKIELKYKLNVIYQFQNNYNISTEDKILRNMYRISNFTTNLQERKRIINSVNKELKSKITYNNGSSIFRKVI
ncbi:hypothetical protein [Haliovirga abyssi]|uniref:Uncharacterized protein n=1 Tax=Haliovirga abyssi TaxID=2996794 RepID=A0AAU9DNA2_9FUSO|nr:hypothetical protein [Haliovirga abyssi]BDU49813.1 hypothetical protein HLVA_03820 [Haliovirga abyssi]